MKKLFIVFALVLTSAAAQAVEKRYVTDTLWLQLRSGPSQEYRILKALQSGEHLIFISEDEATGYTKVKTDKGIEGWVLTRFLETEPVAKEKLILANRELEKLQAELETAQNQKAEFQAEVERLKSERSGLGRENSDLEQQLERITNISENALTLDEKVKKLTQRNQDLEIRLQRRLFSPEHEFHQLASTICARTVDSHRTHDNFTRRLVRGHKETGLTVCVSHHPFDDLLGFYKLVLGLVILQHEPIALQVLDFFDSHPETHQTVI